MEIKELRRIKNLIKPTIRIGKNGLSLGLLQEIENQLNKKGVIKIKILKNFVDENNIDITSFSNALANKLNANLLEVRGKTIILYKKDTDIFKPSFIEKCDKL